MYNGLLYFQVTLVEGKLFESKLAIMIHGRKKNLGKIDDVPDRNEYVIYRIICFGLQMHT
jgi:hypothetical protein